MLRGSGSASRSSAPAAPATVSSATSIAVPTHGSRWNARISISAGDTARNTLRTVSMPIRFASPIAAAVTAPASTPVTSPAGTAAPASGSTRSPEITRGRVTTYPVRSGTPISSTQLNVSTLPTTDRESNFSIMPTRQR